MIETKGLSKQYGAVSALDNIDLKIKSGEVTVILGGSGSGKTTLLRLLAGLESPTSGSIMFADEDLATISRKRLYELRLRVGMLFQYSALLNSLTVYENVAFPLNEHTKLDKEVIHTMVMMKLEQVGLRGFEEMMPSQL